MGKLDSTLLQPAGGLPVTEDQSGAEGGLLSSPLATPCHQTWISGDTSLAEADVFVFDVFLKQSQAFLPGHGLLSLMFV